MLEWAGCSYGNEYERSECTTKLHNTVTSVASIAAYEFMISFGGILIFVIVFAKTGTWSEFGTFVKRKFKRKGDPSNQPVNHNTALSRISGWVRGNKEKKNVEVESSKVVPVESVVFDSEKIEKEVFNEHGIRGVEAVW